MKNGLKIVMLIGRFHPIEGGAEIQCRRLSLHLLKNNKVFVLTPSLPHTPHEESLDGLPIRRVGLPLKGKIGSFSYVASGLCWLLLNGGTFDLLHVHMASSPAIVAAIAGKILKKPVVMKIAGSRSTGDIGTSSATWYGKLKLRFLKKHIQFLVCPSQEIKNELTRAGFLESRINVIGNGTDTTEFASVTAEQKKGIRKDLSLPEDGFIGVYCGRLQEGKGLDVLLESWKVLVSGRTGKGALLLIVGDGPLADRLKSEYSQENTVHFAGWKKDIRPYLNAADLFILPSKGEGMSNALVEAMACGLPCVATDIGGNNEMIINGKNGILISPDDVEALAQAMTRLMDDRSYADTMGKAARQFVVDHLSLEHIASKYEALYQTMLSLPLGDPSGI